MQVLHMRSSNVSLYLRTWQLYLVFARKPILCAVALWRNFEVVQSIYFIYLQYISWVLTYFCLSEVASISSVS